MYILLNGSASYNEIIHVYRTFNHLMMSSWNAISSRPLHAKSKKTIKKEEDIACFIELTIIMFGCLV